MRLSACPVDILFFATGIRYFYVLPMASAVLSVSSASAEGAPRAYPAAPNAIIQRRRSIVTAMGHPANDSEVGIDLGIRDYCEIP